MRVASAEGSDGNGGVIQVFVVVRQPFSGLRRSQFWAESRSLRPETRTCTGIYVVDDQEIGLVSDALAIVCQP